MLNDGNRRSEMLSLLGNVNLFNIRHVSSPSQSSLEKTFKFPINLTFSPVIFISIITSMIFSSPDKIPINSIDSPPSVVVS